MIDDGKRSANRGIAGLDAINPYALVETPHMGGQCRANRITGIQQQCLYHSGGTSFPIGTGDRDDLRRGLFEVEGISHLSKALKPHIDHLRMLLADVIQPTGQTLWLLRHQYPAGSPLQLPATAALRWQRQHCPP